MKSQLHQGCVLQTLALAAWMCMTCSKKGSNVLNIKNEPRHTEKGGALAGYLHASNNLATCDFQSTTLLKPTLLNFFAIQVRALWLRGWKFHLGRGTERSSWPQMHQQNSPLMLFT